MPNGYNGKILHVNLTTGAIDVEQPSETFYRTYIGGSALGLYYVLKNTAPGVDPLGPQNVLALSTSVLTGVAVHGLSRSVATARSPLTGLIGDAQAGGFWPAELKFAGFDAMVLYGQSAKPVYLWINNGKVELRDASHLWGMDNLETMQAIRRELGDEKIEVTGIGPAGEQLVRYASIITMANRAHGRTGMGAVMGSKLLKAVAVRGDKQPTVADPEAVKRITRWGVEHLGDVDSLGKYGTAGIVGSQNEAGGLPTRNFTSGVFDGFETLEGEYMAETILKERDTCYACGVKCKRVVEVNGRVLPEYGGPEYETIATLGSYCGISDIAVVSEGNQICNALGMDTISGGATVAWAMECYEKGILKPADVNGLDLRFGNSEAMLQALRAIGRREGPLGQLLAEGSARAAAKIGGASADLLITVKSQEMPAHMPQVKRSLALIYAVNPFGADHMSSEHDPAYNPDAEERKRKRLAFLGLLNPQDSRSLNAEKVRFTYYTELFYSFLDSACMCQFDWGPAWTLYGPEEAVELVRAITGWNVSFFELMKVGERRLNLMRVYNAAEGARRSHDRLPKRMFQPLKGGSSNGEVCGEIEVDQAIDLYYEMAGWDKEGIPSLGKLAELGLAWTQDRPAA
jgi:aldehyde:ferredoxin oxidoreductase